MINQGIDNLYVKLANGDVVDGAVKPKPASCYADENNWVKDVNFGPPTVIVKADFSNVRSVRFRMRMKSGKIQLRRFIKIDEETGAPITEQLQMAIQDWYVTVPVDVSKSMSRSLVPSTTALNSDLRLHRGQQRNATREGDCRTKRCQGQAGSFDIRTANGPVQHVVRRRCLGIRKVGQRRLDDRRKRQARQTRRMGTRPTSSLHRSKQRFPGHHGVMHEENRGQPDEVEPDFHGFRHHGAGR